jgi:hypothetical protein
MTKHGGGGKCLVIYNISNQILNSIYSSKEAPGL